MMPDPAKLGEALGRLTVRAIGYAVLAFPMAALGTWIFHIPYWQNYAIMLVALPIGSVRVSKLLSQLVREVRR